MLVLDTHALVWWVSNDDRLSENAAEAINSALSAGQNLLISSISAWEIAMLIQKGRLVLTMDVEEWLQQVAEIEGIRFVPVDNSISVKSTALPGEFHKDTADRMIVATARHFSASLITADEKIQAYAHVKTLW